MILDATTDSLQVIMGTAATTNNLPFTVYYDEITSASVTPKKNVSTTNGSTAVDLIAAPGASIQRKLKYASIYNYDTSPQTVTIRFNDNGTYRKICVVSLQVGESIQYTVAGGWQSFDFNGLLKVLGTSQVPSGIRILEFFAAINATTNLTLTTKTSYAFYAGKADRAYSSITAVFTVATAIASAVWAELAVYKGTPTIGSDVTLTRCGYIDISPATQAGISSTGIKNVNCLVSGISAGEDIYLVFGTETASTQAAIRAGLVDDIGAGFVQTITNATGSNVRPSLQTSLSMTLQSATAVGWVAWQGFLNT